MLRVEQQLLLVHALERAGWQERSRSRWVQVRLALLGPLRLRVRRLALGLGRPDDPSADRRDAARRRVRQALPAAKETHQLLALARKLGLVLLEPPRLDVERLLLGQLLGRAGKQLLHGALPLHFLLPVKGKRLQLRLPRLEVLVADARAH